MMEKRIAWGQVEIMADGTMFVKLLKQVVDGDMVLFSEPHRFPIEPSVAVADQVAAVNQHLDRLGWGEMDKADVTRLSSYADVVRTPEVVKSWDAKQAAVGAAAAKRDR